MCYKVEKKKNKSASQIDSEREMDRTRIFGRVLKSFLMPETDTHVPELSGFHYFIYLNIFSLFSFNSINWNLLTHSHIHAHTHARLLVHKTGDEKNYNLFCSIFLISFFFGLKKNNILINKTHLFPSAFVRYSFFLMKNRLRKSINLLNKIILLLIAQNV